MIGPDLFTVGLPITEGDVVVQNITDTLSVAIDDAEVLVVIEDDEDVLP